MAVDSASMIQETETGAAITNPRLLNRIANFKFPVAIEKRAIALVVIGVLTFGVCLFFQAALVWASVLMVSFLLVSFALAGLLFIALSYLTSAGWSIVFRRIHEALFPLLFPGLGGIALVMFFHPSLFPWYEQTDHFTGFKQYWLTYSNWLMRGAVYAAIWLGFGYGLRWHSRKQDQDGKLSHTRWNTVLSALFVVTFALSYWLASVDWIMSLEPLWYSTMFGVYNFAGLFSSGIAIVIIFAVWLQKRGPLRGVLKDDHLHVLGMMLLGFTTFWGYIWFSEYMLIWYAGIPEETIHFAKRTHGLWLPLFYLNFFLNWVIPFLALLPRAGKRNADYLARVAGMVLAGRLLDMYLLVIPTVSESNPIAGLAPFGILLAGVGVLMLVVGRALENAPLVPLKDPFVDESLHYHV